MLSESILNGTSDYFAMVRIRQSDRPYWMSTLDSLYSAKKKKDTILIKDTTVDVVLLVKY